jgi:hypothetical protein
MGAAGAGRMRGVSAEEEEGRERVVIVKDRNRKRESRVGKRARTAWFAERREGEC